MSAIALDTISKTFPNGTKALEGFTFHAQYGERVSLVGQSGCGKSTVLRILSGLDKPDDTDESQLSVQSSSIGYVFQDATLLPWKNVWDNIYLPLRMKGVTRNDAKPAIDAMIANVGLSEFAAATPAQLSGGMKMRVSIARALITKPSLLLLDEPFAALDEITRFRLNDLLIDLQKRDGFTVVLVTHSVFEAVYLSQRVAVMSKRPGRILHDLEITRHTNSDGDYRSSKEYQLACAKVSALLQASLNE